MKTLTLLNSIKISICKDLFSKSEMASNSNAKYFFFRKTTNACGYGYEIKITLLFVMIDFFN